MKRKRNGYRFVAAGVVLCLLLGMSAQVVASSISDAQNEINSLEEDLKRAEDLIDELQDEKTDVNQKIAELNQQLTNISKQIISLENQLTAKSQEILAAQTELAAAKVDADNQYAAMKVRIQYMYENNQDSYLKMLMDTKTLTDFLNMTEYISQIENYDREKLQEYEATIEDIAQREAQLEIDYAELEQMKLTVEAQKNDVSALMQQKETELQAIEDRLVETQNAVSDYEEEIQAQEEIIAEIKAAEAAKAAALAAAGKTDTPYAGGTFTWPCPASTRVTSDYGARVSPMEGASLNHKGIDIGADTGTNIVAANSGRVITAAYSATAGNYIMIDHGGGVYTVYMHCSKLLVSYGTTVSAGQVIAQVGSTGISTGSHLHFGVSVNGSYVNPWSYLGSR